MSQLEFPKESKGSRIYQKDCVFRKKSPVIVIMQPTIDNRYFMGTCGRCGKQYVDKC